MVEFLVLVVGGLVALVAVANAMRPVPNSNPFFG
jgi:hypothetical protein